MHRPIETAQALQVTIEELPLRTDRQAMTEALQEVPQAVLATTEAVLHQVVQVSAPAADQATAEAVQEEDTAVADQAEA